MKRRKGFGSREKRRQLPYRLDLLPVIPPYHRRAINGLREGDLVYYGPHPEYYGIGEIVNLDEYYCIVDFRGTGSLGIQKDVFKMKYLIPVHSFNLSKLLKKRS
jgi:hypothetical protein